MEPDSIHTSCRRESSNKSLVVLDKDPISPPTSWPIQNKLDHHWHPVSFIHPTMPIRIQNWNSNISVLLWPLSKNILSLRICWGQEMDNFEACPGDCYERHPTAAGCNFSTWASNRDLWQWILKSRFLSFVILKVSRGKVEILSKEIIRIRCFQINKENWWWWIHFSRSLTLAALKGALVTLCRPLWAVFRKSFNTKAILISKIGH